MIAGKGMEMMLKSVFAALGVDGDVLMHKLGEAVNTVMRKLAEFDTRLQRLEENQQRIIALLESDKQQTEVRQLETADHA